MPAKKMIQYGALPFELRGGETRVVLVTSRPNRRWILPKGRPERGMPPYEVAAHEAYEEAGLIGRIEQQPFFAFDSTKRLKTGREVTCLVKVYLFEVETLLDDWPEKHERERCWASPGEAITMVSEPGLAQLLIRFAALTL